MTAAIRAIAIARYRAKIRRFCVEIGLPKLPVRGFLATVAVLAIFVVLAASLIGLIIGGLRFTAAQQFAVFVVLAATAILPWFIGNLGVDQVTSMLLDSTSRMILRTPAGLAGVVIPAVLSPTLIGATISGLIMGWITALALRLSVVGAILTILTAITYAIAVTTIRFLALTRLAPAIAQLTSSRFNLLFAAASLTLLAGIAAVTPLVVLRQIAPHWGHVLGVVSGSVPGFFQSPVGWTPAVVLVGIAVFGLRQSIRPEQLNKLANAAATLRQPVDRNRSTSQPVSNVLASLPLLKFRNDSALLRLRSFSYASSLLTLGVLILSATLIQTADSSTLSTHVMRSLLTVVSAAMLAEGISDATKLYFSMDADGPAAKSIRRIPQAWNSLLRVRVIYLSLTLAIVSVMLLLVLLLTPLSAHVPFAATGLILGIMSISAVIELPVATALFPRFDWTNINQIGDHPTANALGIGAGVLAAMIAAPLGLGIQEAENIWWPGQPLVSFTIGVTLICLAALLTWPTARLTTGVFRHVAS